MRRKFSGLMLGLATAVLLQTVGEAFGDVNDHFESRRRSNELRRQQAEQANQMTRRPWGGPTTSRQFWREVPERQHRIHLPPGHVIFVPGRHVWIGGRLVFVPPHRKFVRDPHHIHHGHGHKHGDEHKDGHKHEDKHEHNRR